MNYRAHPIQRGEPVPTGTRVKWIEAARRPDEMMLVVADDYVQHWDIGPTEDGRKRIAEARAKADRLAAEFRKADAEWRLLQSTRSTAYTTTGASETLQVVTHNTSGQAVISRVLRSEVEARLNDQDLPIAVQWVSARARSYRKRLALSV